MRLLRVVALFAIAVLIAGCPKPEPAPTATEAPPEGAAPVSEAGAPVVLEESGVDVADEVDLPGCPAEEFGDPDSDVALQAYADLDGDGTDECIIGFQARNVDDLGEPVAPAYVELTKWDGSEWTGWFGVPAPDGETFIDEESLVIAGDINEDGKVELGIQFYGFGVSSRAENLYLWQVAGEGLEPAVEGGVIETSSDDGIVVRDADLSFQGAEIILARAAPGVEAHAEPHRFEISTYAWSSGMYRVVDSSLTTEAFADPFEAIDSLLEP